jgi:hypothetical protein
MMNKKYKDLVFSENARNGKFNMRELSEGLYFEEAYQSEETPVPLASYVSLLILNYIESLKLENRPLSKRIMSILKCKAKPKNGVYSIIDLYTVMDSFLSNYHKIANTITKFDHQIVTEQPQGTIPAQRKEHLIDPSVFGIETTWNLIYKNDIDFVLYTFGCILAHHLSLHLKVIYDAFFLESRTRDATPQGSAGVLIKKRRVNTEGIISTVMGGATDVLVLYSVVHRLIFYDTLCMHKHFLIKSIKSIQIDEERNKNNREVMSSSFKIMDNTEEFRFDLYECLCDKVEPEYFTQYYYYEYKGNMIEHFMKNSNELNIDITARMLRTITPELFDTYIGLQDDLAKRTPDMLLQKSEKNSSRLVRNILILLITGRWFFTMYDYADWLKDFVVSKNKSTNLMRRLMSFTIPWIVEYAPYQWGMLERSPNNNVLWIHEDMDVIIAHWWEHVLTRFKGKLRPSVTLTGRKPWDMVDYEEKNSAAKEFEDELGRPGQPRENIGPDGNDWGDNYLEAHRDYLNSLGVGLSNLTVTDILDKVNVRDNLRKLSKDVEKRPNKDKGGGGEDVERPSNRRRQN